MSFERSFFFGCVQKDLEDNQRCFRRERRGEKTPSRWQLLPLEVAIVEGDNTYSWVSYDVMHATALDHRARCACGARRFRLADVRCS